MSRISIDVSAEDHKRLKAWAALRGLALKDYLLRSTPPSEGDKEELAEMEFFLDERVRQAQNGRISKRTVGDIFQQAYQEADGQNPSRV